MNKYSSYILYMLISVFVVILYLNDFGPISSLQTSLNDLLSETAANEGMSQNVVMVDIDGRAMDEYGAWPWNHDRIADLIAATASAEPKAILVYFDLSENSIQDSAGYTSILAEQLSWIDNVVLPYEMALSTFRSGKTRNPDHLFLHSLAVNNPLGLLEESSSLHARRVFLPADKLLKGDPYLGFDYSRPDEDRQFRHQPLVVNFDGYYYPSVSLITAALYLGIKSDDILVVENKSINLANERSIPISGPSECIINFSADRTFATYSAAAVLGEGFNFGLLKDKVVIIGSNDPLITESFSTPSASSVPKPILKANIIDNIIMGNLLQENPKKAWFDILIIFLLGGICAFALPQVSTLYRIVILSVGLIITANVSYFMLNSFGIITDTLFFGVEIILFMLASPLIDSSLLTGESNKKRTKSALPRITIDSQESQRQAAEFPVREIKSDPNASENQPTTMIDTEERQSVDDHQAIDIDGPQSSANDSDATGMVDSLDHQVIDIDSDGVASEESDSAEEPEIISPPGFDSAIIDPKKGPGEQVSDSSDVNTSQTPPGGIKSLGRYQITGTLGKGAMGHVYLGVDPAINRPVALKTIRLDLINDPQEMAELKERLFREARAVGKMSHPNIVTIYDVGSEGQLQYIAMEYLEGQTLEEMIKKKTKFNYRIIAKIIVQICAALEYAHKAGIVHRDIKPANIMILKDFSVKVMDYGIARVDSSSMTKTGIAMGTPNYISPEQLQGHDVDHRADIFSLGIVIYELLLGRRPFKGENITSLIYSILHHEPPKPSSVDPQIPALFDHVTMKALKKNASERYQKASDLVNDISDFVESFSVK